MPIIGLVFWDYLSASLLSLSVFAASISPNLKDLDNDEDNFYSALQSSEEEKRDAVRDKTSDGLVVLNDKIDNAPAVDDSMNVSTANPLTMPDYLKQQNELMQSLVEKTNSLISHTAHQNSLYGESLKLQLENNANNHLMAETLSSSFPALILQMQEVAKFPTILRVKTEMEDKRHSELIETMKSLELSPEINIPDNNQALSSLTSASILQNEELRKISSHLEATAELAKAQTTVARVTDLEGNVVAELKPWELSTYKDLAVVKAKEKEKEISDYYTTPISIKNIDGKVVTTAKPMEMQTVKNAVEAKNGTDEMEFEMPDDILDHLFQPIPLPTFTKYEYDKQNEFMFNGGSL